MYSLFPSASKVLIPLSLKEDLNKGYTTKPR